MRTNLKGRDGSPYIITITSAVGQLLYCDGYFEHLFRRIQPKHIVPALQSIFRVSNDICVILMENKMLELLVLVKSKTVPHVGLSHVHTTHGLASPFLVSFSNIAVTTKSLQEMVHT